MIYRETDNDFYSWKNNKKEKIFVIAVLRYQKNYIIDHYYNNNFNNYKYVDNKFENFDFQLLANLDVVNKSN